MFRRGRSLAVADKSMGDLRVVDSDARGDLYYLHGAICVQRAVSFWGVGEGVRVMRTCAAALRCWEWPDVGRAHELHPAYVFCLLAAYVRAALARGQAHRLLAEWGLYMHCKT